MEKELTGLISIRECARRLEVSDTAIRKAIKTDRVQVAARHPDNGRPLLDYQDVVKKWKANTDPNMQRNGSGSGFVSPTSPVANVGGGVAVSLEAQPHGGTPKRSKAEEAPEVPASSMAELEGMLTRGEVLSPNQSRQIKEAYSARREKMEFEKEAGMLVDRASVESEMFAIARRVRDSILNVCDRIDAELASMTDPQAINLRLRRELIEAMEGLSNVS